jgi:hypothetical protein
MSVATLRRTNKLLVELQGVLTEKHFKGLVQKQKVQLRRMMRQVLKLKPLRKG